MINLKLALVSLTLCSNLAWATADAEPESPPNGRRTMMPKELSDDARSEGEQARLIEQLWQTPLGQLFHRYLFDLKEGESAMKAAHEIVDRIHSDVKMTITRQSALTMMRENIFDKGKLTAGVYERLMLLDAGLATRQQALQRDASREFLHAFPLFVGLAIAGGSPFVRNSMKKVPGDLWHLIRTAIRREDAHLARAAVLARLNPRRYWDPRFRKGYSFGKAYSTLWQSFGPSYLVYHVYRTGSADSVAAQNKIWVYGMQRLVSLDEI